MRDDFPQQMKRDLATRVAYRCSNPECRATTAGPRVGPAGFINVGVAAHISAASPGGPRFDPTLTSAERSHGANGIWLCQNCAKLIDADPGRFPAERLYEWKRKAEEAALKEIGRTISTPYQRAGGERLRVCGFDFDGTLLRGTGFRYSWQNVWSHLGYSDDLRRRLFAKYTDQVISYEEWCNECILYFRKLNLRRRDFALIAQSLRPTAHLREALALLRHEDIAVGIISGGIDTLLEETVPDYNEIFDFVYINRFLYDKDGVVVGVDPTLYDFEGKITALHLECQRRGVELSQAVFVGEGKNDQYVIEEMRKTGVGLTIAYPPVQTDVENLAHEVIPQDDLMLVAQAIIRHL